MPPARDARSQSLGLRGLLRYAAAVLDLRNRLLRLAFRLGRRLLPVLRVGNTAYVLRWADVRSVLERPEDFSVRIFAMRMADTAGVTFLGMNPSDRYVVESSAMRAALGVPDPRPHAFAGPEAEPLGRLTWVRRFGAQLAGRQVANALKSSPKHEVDVVSALADLVPLHFAREFFGTPEPDPPAIQTWFKTISYYVFAPAAHDWAGPAKLAGRSAAAHFEHLVSERHAAVAAGQRTPDDVLGRLIEMQNGPTGLADEAIVRSLSFISGVMIPTSWLFIEAADRLMRLPRSERESLHRYAVEGDRAAVRAYVIEAARFFPFPFMIVRYAEREAEIAGKLIPPGTAINLMIGSATLDPSAVPRAADFVPGRPESEYMLFGHDVHLCQGKDIAEELLTEMTIALFSQRNLRRAPGPRGYIRYDSKQPIPDGPYPLSLILRADL